MPTTVVAARTRPYVRARHRVALGLSPCPAEVGRARLAVRGCLSRWRLGAHADSVLLVLSELLGNALRHASCPVIALTVTAGGGDLLIEVRDGSGRPPVIDPSPDPYGETGRGLPLVDALSRDWGWTPHEDGTKTTWALLPACDGGPA